MVAILGSEGSSMASFSLRSKDEASVAATLCDVAATLCDRGCNPMASFSLRSKDEASVAG
eukprot:scaffold84801_cov21-Phaeocystis_antarctica.AAC.1